MHRKWLGLVGAVCLIMGSAMPVQARQTGSVQLLGVWCGQRIPGGEVILSRVGDRTPEGFRITDGLADWTVSEEEALSGIWTDRIKQQEGSTWIRTVSRETGATFDDLPEGLYLVRQKEGAPEFLAFRPFLLSIPQGEQWEIVREISLVREGEAPATGDRHVPLIGAMGLGLSAAVLMVLADHRKK